MFSHSLRGLLTISTPDTLRALQSTSPGTGSALPVRDPEANVPSASTNGHVNNSLRQGACHPSCPLGGTGPLHTRCSEAQTQERQSWALARIGGQSMVHYPGRFQAASCMAAGCILCYVQVKLLFGALVESRPWGHVQGSGRRNCARQVWNDWLGMYGKLLKKGTSGGSVAATLKAWRSQSFLTQR
eukprot:1160272-Pelagomonas_calceolata.AAC.2